LNEVITMVLKINICVKLIDTFKQSPPPIYVSFKWSLICTCYDGNPLLFTFYSRHVHLQIHSPSFDYYNNNLTLQTEVQIFRLPSACNLTCYKFLRIVSGHYTYRATVLLFGLFNVTAFALHAAVSVQNCAGKEKMLKIFVFIQDV